MKDSTIAEKIARVEKHEVNPFIRDLYLSTSKIKSGFYKNEEEEDMYLPANKVVEVTPHIKLYVNSGIKDIAFKLSARGIRLLMWIMLNLKTKKDIIYVNYTKIMKDIDCSAMTVREGIKDLVRAGLVSPTSENNIIWVNPSYFFRGSRINKYVNKVKIRYNYAKKDD